MSQVITLAIMNEHTLKDILQGFAFFMIPD